MICTVGRIRVHMIDDVRGEKILVCSNVIYKHFNVQTMSNLGRCLSAIIYQAIGRVDQCHILENIDKMRNLKLPTQ